MRQCVNFISHLIFALFWESVSLSASMYVSMSVYFGILYVCLSVIKNVKIWVSVSILSIVLFLDLFCPFSGCLFLSVSLFASVYEVCLSVLPYCLSVCLLFNTSKFGQSVNFINRLIFGPCFAYFCEFILCPSLCLPLCLSVLAYCLSVIKHAKDGGSEPMVSVTLFFIIIFAVYGYQSDSLWFCQLAILSHSYSVCLFVRPSVRHVPLIVFLSIRLPVCLSVSMFLYACILACLSVCVSVCLSCCLSTYLSVSCL